MSSSSPFRQSPARIAACLSLFLAIFASGQFAVPAAQGQVKYGMFDESHVFEPPVYIVCITKQYTQNGVIEGRTYMMMDSAPPGATFFIGGANSEVELIGGPCRTPAEAAAGLPDGAVAWNGGMSAFVAWPADKPRDNPAAGNGGELGEGPTGPSGYFPMTEPGLYSGEAGAEPQVHDDMSWSEGRLAGNANANLTPVQVTVEDVPLALRGGNNTNTNRNRNRRQRFQLPPLGELLFGAVDTGEGVRGSYFSINPDGSTNALLGTFVIQNGDAFMMFPAGGDEINVLLNDAPSGGVLATDYAHYMTNHDQSGYNSVPQGNDVRIPTGSGDSSIPQEGSSRSSGDLNFLISGGPVVDAEMIQQNISINAPNGIGGSTMEQESQPYPIRFILDGFGPSN